jgi:heme exporter protein CcmD
MTLSMGGYAPYIWSAYSLVILVLTGSCLLIKVRQRKTRQFLRQWFERGDSGIMAPAHADKPSRSFSELHEPDPASGVGLGEAMTEGKTG